MLQILVNKNLVLENIPGKIVVDFGVNGITMIQVITSQLAIQTKKILFGQMERLSVDIRSM